MSTQWRCSRNLLSDLYVWRCQHPGGNWLCLCCKEVLCSRYVNKHMLQHYQETNHSVALGYKYDYELWSLLYFAMCMSHWLCLNWKGVLNFYILWFVNTLFLANQWPVSLVFRLPCIFKCSSDSATATCSWDCLRSEIWSGPPFPYGRAS